ncbi:MAG: response regulator [Alteraurantiacibacter sp.]
MIANLPSSGAGNGGPSKTGIVSGQKAFRQSKASKGDIRILLVEDDYFAALTLENALADAGYQLAGVVDNAEEALAMLGADGPDLVVCDIRLAGKLDGLAVAKEATKFSIPFIVASAHTDAETRARGDALSPAGWLVKPFGVTDFLMAIDAALWNDTGH